MFGIFKNKKLKPSVTPEDQDWIEKNIDWLIKSFGIDHIKEAPFILPTPEVFSYHDYHDRKTFRALLEQICEIWELDPKEIQINFFDDLKTQEWSTWFIPVENTKPLGTYQQEFTLKKERFIIQIAKSVLGHPQQLIYVLAHELAHMKLLGGNYMSAHQNDMELVTDLATIFRGFGIFVANCCEMRDINLYYWQMSRTGYLPNEVISYTNALLCFMSGQKPEDYKPYLNTNTRALFLKDYQFLQKTQDTLFTEAKVVESENIYLAYQTMDNGFKNQQFDEVIKAASQLLDFNKRDQGLINNIGYALLQQKKYEEAITEFNKAITIDPFWDYPFNNRGYCRLQLGDFEGAYTDIYSSLEMNPENPFSLRNMGVYYLVKENYSKALEYLEKSLKIYPQTELINFYLGKTHYKLGNQDKADFFLNRSKEMNEYNDSLME